MENFFPEIHTIGPAVDPKKMAICAEKSISKCNPVFFPFFAGNPVICSCQSYVQKIWLRQHRKWLETDKRGSKVGPQCVEPTPILDRYLLTVKDSELCPLPSVSSLQLSNIRPYSFLVTWDSPDNNMTGLKGFIVAYHRLERNDQVKKYRLPPAIRGFQIEQVKDDTLYLVCVVTRGSSWRSVTSNEEAIRASAVIDADDFEDDGLGGLEDESEFEVDVEALEMLGLIRRERDTLADDEEMFVAAGPDPGGGGGGSSSFFPDWVSSGNPFDSLMGTVYPTEEGNLSSVIYPNSNDTNLLVVKPTLVNLGSKSSKCTEIRTPIDPTKLRFIDNKRMSIIIGCIAGVIVFIGILASIIMNRDRGDGDGELAPDAGEESLSGSHKSPGSKTFRSDSLNTNYHIGNHRPHGGGGGGGGVGAGATLPSRKNSQSSSLLAGANRLSLAEPGGGGGGHGGPDHLPNHVPNRRSQPGSNSGTLKRGQNFGRQQSDIQPLTSSLVKQQSYSSSGGRLMSKQSSTESGPSSSNRLSRQSSSETTGGGPRAVERGQSRPVVPPPGGMPNVMPPGSGDPYQSWHGTPRAVHRSAAAAELNQSTLPRRNFHNTGSLEHKRRSAGAASDPTAIPLIEYSLVENGHHHQQDDPASADIHGAPVRGATNPSAIYAVPDRARAAGSATGARPKVTMNDQRVIRTGNHIGAASTQPLMSNHLDSEAAEAEESIDYYPDEPTRHQPLPNNRMGYIKYNSFANY